jgi:hypothetical protein
VFKHRLVAGSTEPAATLPNCGDTLKLSVPSCVGNGAVAEVNHLGYGNKPRDATMGDPQPTPKELKRGFSSMEGVHRLDDSGCVTRRA